jgi:hypothetical protein
MSNSPVHPAAVHAAMVSPDEVRDALRALYEHSRLVKLVKTMSDEIERLHEDNAQLHAAVKMYREVARRRHDALL